MSRLKWSVSKGERLMSLMNDPVKAKEYFAAKMAFTTGPVELDGMMKKGQVQVVDVRREEDFKSEHIPGSVNLPRSRWDTLEGLARDRSNIILCYSQTCHLAATAAVQFANSGFSVVELEGGFKGWKEHKLPIEGQRVARELREELGTSLAELRETRDTLRVRMHVASLDAKDKWRELESRLEKLENQIADATDSALQKLRDGANDLKGAFRSLREKMR
jgi:rhodanese-related sulfurtransferase